MLSHSVVSNSLWPHGLQPARLLCPQDSPGKNTEVGCHFCLQGIFPTQGSNPGLPHCRQTLYPLSHQGTPTLPEPPEKHNFRCSVKSLSCALLFVIHGLQHTRPPCPSPTPRAYSNYSNSCPSSQWCHLIISSSVIPFSSAFSLSSIKVFSSESVLPIRRPKCWSFSFSISPSNEHSGLISFRMNWLNLLAVQGTLKSLLQHHSSTASILWGSAFFMFQLSHSYMTTGKILALTRRTFVSKVTSLLLICCLGW